MTERLLTFPDDLAAGRLWIERPGHAPWAADARGTVRVPRDATVHLSADCPVRGLYQLAPDAIDSLQLPKKKAQDEDLRHIAHLRRLRELHLSKSIDVTDAGVAALADMTQLRYLNLYWTALTDDALGCLTRMPHLEYLHLGLTRIQGPGLAHLVGLQRLHTLSVEETDVGDAALHHVSRLRSLKRLALWGTRVSHRGLAALRAALPKVEISMRDPGQRLAAERRRDGVLRILLRRLEPHRALDGKPVDHLAELAPPGSAIHWRLAPGARIASVDVSETDRLAGVLARRAGEIRLVTPDGPHAWVPWLQRRGTDRRRYTRGKGGARERASG